MKKRRTLATLIECCGLAALMAGLFHCGTAAGLIGLGALLLVAGAGVECAGRKRRIHRQWTPDSLHELSDCSVLCDADAYHLALVEIADGLNRAEIYDTRDEEDQAADGRR